MPHTPMSPNMQPLADSGLTIAMGVYPELSHVNKFGTNESIGTTFENVWAYGGVWTPLAIPTLLEIASTSTDDTLAGIGAQKVVIQGLDFDYEEIEEEVEMAGQTPVTTSNIYRYVNRMYVSQAGDNPTFNNVGEIAIADDDDTWTGGAPNTQALVQGSIVATHGQTQQATYTVPINKVAFLRAGYITADSSKIVTFRYFIQTNGGTRRIAFEGTVSGGPFQQPFHPYPSFPEKTTMFCEAKVSATTAQVSAGFDLILLDKPSGQ